MVETVEQPTPIRGAPLWPISVEAYHVLGEAGFIPENTELLYGLVYTKMPKSPFHSFLVESIAEMIKRLNLPGVFVRSEQPLTFQDSEPEPDVAIIRGARKDFTEHHPTSAELVIEVCITSQDYDRSKLRAYASANIQECWLVLPEDKHIEVYSEPKGNAYGNLVRHTAGTLKSTNLSGLEIDFNELFQQ